MTTIKRILSMDNILFSTKTNQKCLLCGKSESDMVGNLSELDNIMIFCSDELCLNCEILQFPERFHGCGFCKRPVRSKFSCSICTHGFVEWIKDVIKPLDNVSKLIRNSASDLINKSVSDLPIEHRKFIIRTDDSFYKWPGFYAGITNRFCAKLKQISDKKNGSNSDENNFFPIWIIPDLIKKYDVKIFKFKFSFKKILLDILKVNGINLYEDVQINPYDLNMEQIRAINPYDTRLVIEF
jgi:hypothetical protein